MSDLPDPPPVSWNPPVPGSSWEPTAWSQPDPPSPDLPLIATGEPVTPPKPRRRAAAIVGAGALVAAGAFAVTRIAGGSDGGADSPRAAIEQLVTALNEEDALGAMDVLLPGERRTFQQPMTDLVSELRRLEVLGKDADLGKIGGADLEITVDDMEVDEVADDIANVTMSGDASIDIDPSKLPLGDLIVEDLLGGDRPEGSTRQDAPFGDDTGDAITLTTVRRDGRWYVSLFYTVAEAARGDADLPDAADAIEPDGADSPEGAVDQMMGAVADLDLEAIIATLDPNEFEALQRYAPIFLADAQDALDELDGVSVRWRDAEYDVDGRSGGHAAVGFGSFRIDGSADGQDVSLEWDGSCMSLDGSDLDTAKGCADDEATIDADHVEESAMIGFAKAFAGTHPILATEVDGKWYVSVFGSFFDGMLDALKSVDADELKDGIAGIGDALDEGLGGVLGGGDVFGTDVFGTDVIDIGTDDTIPFDTVPDDGSTDDTSPDITLPDSSAVDECYQKPDAATASSCFEEGVASGTIVADDVPPALRFAECGIAEGWWDYTVYTELGDEEFTALMTSAHSCFLEHVDVGELEEYLVPYEASAPECWGGKNPYLMSDDDYSAAIDAYSACSGQ